MIVFNCHVCRTTLSGPRAGMALRCPTCMSVVTVPDGVAEPAAAGAGAARLRSGPAMAGQTGLGQTSSGQMMPGQMMSTAPLQRSPAGVPGGRSSASNRRYCFYCGYCSSRLEATEAIAAKTGQCPTCGNQITIPYLDRYGRLIDPKTQQIIKPDPHPVHAYAAAGERAPLIIRGAGGKQNIQCPRCAAASPITANNCKGCGMPFTMEGATQSAGAGNSNGFCVASLVLGIIGIPASFTVVAPLLAIVFGIVGMGRIQEAESVGSSRTMAIIGIILGVVGVVITLRIYGVLG